MKILLGTDGSHQARIAEQLVETIPWPKGSLITVVHAQEAMPGIRGMPDDAYASLYNETKKSIEDQLAQLESRLAAPGRAVDGIVPFDRPASAIVDEARRMGADLVVVGSRGRGALASTLLGSVAAEVVDHSPCPVLVARAPQVARVLVADDGSDSAREAEELIAGWSFLRAPSVRAVSVVDLSGLVQAETGMEMMSGDAYQRMFDDLRDLHARYAREAAERLRPLDPKVSWEAREGFVGSEIVAAAARAGADLIVIGTRGRTGLARLLLGSVARSVLFHSPTSVLIVRPRKAGGGP